MLFFAKYWGAGDDKGINRAYGTTMTFLMIVSFTGGILAMVKPELIMHVYTGRWIKPVTEQGRLALADFQKNRKNPRCESRDQKK